MKPKKKTSAIAKAIEDSVFANVNDGEISDENHDDTRAKVAEKDDDDFDIFTRDFASEESQKPSKLRILNAGTLGNDKRYKGKKVSRKDLQKSNEDSEDDLEKIENNSDDSEDEAMNMKEHAEAELGYMFEMDGVEYDDEDDFQAKKKKNKFRSMSPDLEHLEEDFEEEFSEDEMDKEMSEKVIKMLGEDNQDGSDGEESEDETDEEDDDSEEEENDFKDQIKKLGKKTKDETDEDEEDNETDDDDESDEEENSFMDQIKKLGKKTKAVQDEDEDESIDDEDENDDEMEEENDFKNQIKKLGRKTKVNEDEEDDDENDDEDEDDDESDEDDLGPDLSEMMEGSFKDKDSDIEEEATDAQVFSTENVEKEVKKGQSIQRQLKVWDGLLELRIALQKSLVKINQFPVDLKPYKESLEEEENDLKSTQVNLAKVLDQLLELKKAMLNKNKVLPKDGSPLAKKRKLQDYENTLENGLESMKQWRNETLEDWNDRTRIAGKNGFSGFETSVTRQIDHILADKSRLVKRTKLKRSAFEILGQDEEDEAEENDEIFDDDDFYHQLLRELIERKTSGMTDPIALGQQWLQLQKIRSKASKKVDTKASKGRKTRYDIHSKLVNFMAPTYVRSTMTEEAKSELFASLFRGQKA